MNIQSMPQGPAQLTEVIIVSAPDDANRITHLIAATLEEERDASSPRQIAIDPQQLPIAVALAIRDHADEIFHTLMVPHAPDGLITRIGLYTWAIIDAKLAKSAAKICGAFLYEPYSACLIDYMQAGEFNHMTEQNVVLAEDFVLDSLMSEEKVWPSDDPTAHIFGERDYEVEGHCVAHVIAGRKLAQLAMPELVLTAGPETVMTQHDWDEQPYYYDQKTILTSQPTERAAQAAIALSFDLGLTLDISNYL